MVKDINNIPVVGVLAQDLTDQLKEVYGHQNYTTYIAASYVKYLESAGARVLPVFTGMPDIYYEKVFNYTNGLLLPGGDVSISDSGLVLKDVIFTDYPDYRILKGFQLKGSTLKAYLGLDAIRVIHNKASKNPEAFSTNLTLV